RTAGELRAAGAVRRGPRSADRDALTAQEIRVARAIARGLTNRQAASELFLSPKTIDFHLRQIYGKLAIRSRAELALVAARRGWLDAAS
ncbi:MAG: LuxR C-terminal-related transcriptional regulator, partial [Thermodesulfobacteriota bacterium]